MRARLPVWIAWFAGWTWAPGFALIGTLTLSRRRCSQQMFHSGCGRWFLRRGKQQSTCQSI